MTRLLLETPRIASWYRLDVCTCDALARTRVRVLGALGMDAVDEIDRAVMTAEVQEHALVLDLGQVSTVTPEAMRALLARGRRPRVSFAR